MIKGGKKIAKCKKPCKGSTPIPCGGGSCGHSKCAETCRVRYWGPTSHLHDHHILHAAHGVGNIWMAAIITGLAIVLTGAVAWSAVEAKDSQQQKNVVSTEKRVINIDQRLNNIEKALAQVRQACGGLKTTEGNSAP